MKPTAFLTVIGLGIISSQSAFAHCDSLDGPVIKAAQIALETADVQPVLIWVKANDEAEIRSAFERTLAVRKLNVEARKLADHYFFETLVRVHRAGEGAAYTGLKPAGQDLDPAIPAADKALRDKEVEPLIRFLTEIISQQVRAHFHRAAEKSNFAKENISAGREFVEAYVEYIHCVEGLYRQAVHDVQGHVEDAAGGHDHHKP